MGMETEKGLKHTAGFQQRRTQGPAAHQPQTTLSISADAKYTQEGTGPRLEGRDLSAVFAEAPGTARAWRTPCSNQSSGLEHCDTVEPL